MRLTLALACSLLLVLAATPRSAPETNGEAGRSVLADKAAPRFGPGDSQGRTGAPQFVSGPVRSHPADRGLSRSLLAAPRRISGTATWCAPTPRYCRNWGGKAMLAAVPSFRYGDEPYTVQVTGFHGGKANAVLVTVVSYCDCGRTVIDLSPHAFAQLAPLSVGRIRVVVDGVRAGRPIPLAPQTDTDGG